MINRCRRKPFPGVWIITGILVGLLFSACGDKDPLLIGFVGGTSGRVADLGISGRDAVQLAVDQCNRAGGIHGRQVQLVMKDDQQDPDIARQAVQDMIRKGVAAVIGPMTSDMGLAVLPLLDEAGLLAVSPTGTSQSLSGRDDHFFRVCSTTREFAVKSADYQIRSGNMRRISAIYDKSNLSFCKNWLENFTETFTALGGEVIHTLEFQAGEERSFLELGRDLLRMKPDGILIIANSMDSAMLCQQIHKLDPDIAITLADWGATERLLELGGKAVEGVTVVQTFNRDNPNPRFQDFRKEYLDRFHREPGFPGVYAHDAVQVVFTALKTRKKNQTLKDTVLSLKKFQGLQNDFSFDAFGDVERLNASINIVQNQKFIVVD